MTQYIDSTAEKHGLSTVPDDEDKDKWLLLGDDTHDFGWDATNLPPGVHCAAPEGQSIIAEGDLFDQETVVSLELVSEADDSKAAGMSSMITAESIAFESVTEGTSTSKQPPTPPPSRRGAAAKSAAGEPEMGDESDPTAAGSTDKPQVKAMPRIAKAKVPPGHRGNPGRKSRKTGKTGRGPVEVEDMGHVPKVNMDRD